ncbi:iron ABC transporter substrate-binding protein [Allosalinactinospora lopnorensis]|uniref:iron ABC transporter substrate-binding protein n=1 Tax=Allosalinactinospora lopnorensis TaxID=1352348 RepID=UPI000697D7DE|nr:iron ABC transporter substrate-binding protein [Allosalinactinospora lopnorensis]
MRAFTSGRRGLLVTALPVFALFTAGCGPAADDGGGDDTVTIYSGREEDLVQPIIDRLEEETGLQVEVRYGDTADLAAQLQTEGDRSEGDVYLAQDAGSLGLLVQDGLLAELPSDILDRVPEEYRADSGEWVGLSGRSRVIAYDPEEVDTPPDSVMDLTGDEWEGKVGIAPTNGSFQAFVTALRVIEGDEAAQRWLQDLNDNGVQSYENNRAMLDALDNGEIAVSLNNHYYWYERVKEQGEDAVGSELHYLPDGDAGALVNVSGAGVLAASGNQEEAQQALEFLLGEEAQEYFTQETSEYPLVEGVETMEELPELSELQQPDIDLSDLHSLEESVEMIQEAGLA